MLGRIPRRTMERRARKAGGILFFHTKPPRSRERAGGNGRACSAGRFDAPGRTVPRPLGGPCAQNEKRGARQSRGGQKEGRKERRERGGTEMMVLATTTTGVSWLRGASGVRSCRPLVPGGGSVFACAYAISERSSRSTLSSPLLVHAHENSMGSTPCPRRGFAGNPEPAVSNFRRRRPGLARSKSRPPRRARA